MPRTKSSTAWLDSRIKNVSASSIVRSVTMTVYTKQQQEVATNQKNENSEGNKFFVAGESIVGEDDIIG